MKIAYIDHSFHKKTKSNDFLFETLSEDFYVKRFWDYRWKGGKGVDFGKIKDEEFDTLLIFQVFYNPLILKKKYGFKNIIWVPMADSHGEKNYKFFSVYKDFKIISFSREIHLKSLLAGVNSIHVKYFPEPVNIENIPDFEEGLKVFFWYRRKTIDIETIKSLLNGYSIKRMIIHNSPDPSTKQLMIKKEDFDFEIEETRWFSQKNEYFSMLEKCNIFVNPRVREGIGLSFLEAMARGIIVIAHNEPTMNEYITHRKTGFLFDALNPRRIEDLSLKTLTSIKEALLVESKNYFYDWLEKKKNITNFVATQHKSEVSIDSKFFSKLNSLIPEEKFALLMYYKDSDIEKFNVILRSLINSEITLRLKLHLLLNFKMEKDLIENLPKDIKISIKNIKFITKFIVLLNNREKNISALYNLSRKILNFLESNKYQSFTNDPIYADILLIVGEKQKAEKVLSKIFYDKSSPIKKRVLGGIKLFEIKNDKKIRTDIRAFFDNFCKENKNIKKLRLIDRYRIASFSKKQGNILCAKKVFETIVKSRVTNDRLKSGAHFHLGEIFENEGDKCKAIEHYTYTLNLFPEHVSARERLKKLRN